MKSNITGGEIRLWEGGKMIRYFDIFAGIGGFRSGLEKAGDFKCVGYCEIDKYAKKAYETMYDTENEV